MRTAQICPTCSTFTNALCVIYNGDYLSTIDVAPLDTLEGALGKIDDSVADVITLINNYAASPIILTTNGTSGPATVAGNILNVPNYQPTLQDVLSVGDASDQNINLADDTAVPTRYVRLSPTGLSGSAEVFIEDLTSTWYIFSGFDGGVANGTVKVGNPGGTSLQMTPSSLIYIDDFSGDTATLQTTPNSQVLTLPNTSGTLAISVNGYTADASGEITLPTSAGVSTVKVTVSSSELLNLFTSPVTILPAPGAGKFLNVLRVYYRMNFGTTAYGGGASLSMVLSTGVVSFTIVNSTANILNVTSTSFVRPPMTTTTTVADFGYDNEPLVLKASAAPTLGDGTLDVYVTYETITL